MSHSIVILGNINELSWQQTVVWIKFARLQMSSLTIKITSVHTTGNLQHWSTQQFNLKPYARYSILTTLYKLTNNNIKQLTKNKKVQLSGCAATVYPKHSNTINTRASSYIRHQLMQ